MFDRIARLGRETALYGLSTVLGRMLNFLLVPLYANALLPAENGVVATLYAYIAFAAVLYGFGMEQAFMRFWADADNSGRTRVLRTAMLGLAPGLALTVVVILSGASGAAFLGFSEGDAPLLRFAAIILLLDSAAAVPFVLLRMEHRPLAFASLKTMNIALTLVLTFVFLVPMQAGVHGVFQANLIASGMTLLAVWMTTRSSWRSKDPEGGVRWDLFKQLLRFGVPLVPASLAGVALLVVDRPILQALTDDATVGIYQINVRLGIVMMLAVGMFDFAWRPFYLQHARDTDAPAMFARVFTYFMSLLGVLFLLTSFFVDDVIRIPVAGGTMLPETYWEGASIVPVVLLSHALNGAYLVFLSGTYIEKKTGRIPLIIGCSAVVTVAGNFMLVPSMGIMGAACAMLAGRLVEASWMYVEGRRWLRVPYEWRRVTRLCLWTAVVYLITAQLSLEALTLAGLAVKTAIVAAYVAGLFVLRVLRAGEFRAVLPS